MFAYPVFSSHLRIFHLLTTIISLGYFDVGRKRFIFPVAVDVTVVVFGSVPKAFFPPLRSHLDCEASVL